MDDQWDGRAAELELLPGGAYRVASSGHLPGVLHVPVEPTDALDVTLRRGASARLRFVDRGRPVLLEAWGWHPLTFPWEGLLEARHEDPEVAVHSVPRDRYAGGPYGLVSEAPGRVLVDVTPPADYLPVPTVELDVDFGAPREVVVELERIPSLR